MLFRNRGIYYRCIIVKVGRGAPGISIPIFLIIWVLVLKVCGSPAFKLHSGHLVYGSLVLVIGMAVLEDLATRSTDYRSTITIRLVFKESPEPG